MPVDLPDVEAVLEQRVTPVLRRCGIYVDKANLYDYGGRTVVVVEATLGDLAFRDSVQRPEEQMITEAFETMAIEEAKGSVRKREMFDRLRQGKPLLEDQGDTA